MKRLSSVFALAALASLTACGGGTGTSTSLPAVPKTSQMQDVQFRITIPQSVRLSPKYISSSTQSASITVTPAGAAALAPVNVNCTSSCSATVSAPVGSDQFTVNLYDATNAAGHVLSTGTATQTIVAGTANTVALTFGGVVASIAVALASSTVSSAGTVGVTVTAKDAANQTIVGSAAYNNAITLTDTDASGATSLNTTSVTSPATSVILTYSGASAFVSAVVGASASGVAPSAVTAATLTKGAGSVSGINYMTLGTNRADGVLNGGSTQATIVAISSAGVLDGSGGTIPTGAPTLTLGTTAASSASRFVMAHTNPEPRDVGPHVLEEQIIPGARRVLEKEARMPLTRAAQSITRVKKSYLPTTLNATQGIWVQNGSIGGSSGSFVAVPSTLAYISAYGYIWIDNTLLAANGGPLGSAEAKTLGDVFDNSYNSDTQHFAGALYTNSAPALASSETSASGCDATGASTGIPTPRIVAPDTRIAVMVVNPASLGGGVGGYFYGLNYFPQAYANCVSPGAKSNESAMIVVGYSIPNGPTFELQEDLVRGTAHELQHLINFVNHRILVPRNASGGFAREDASFDEGLAMLSQDFAVQRLYGSSGVNFDVADAMGRAAKYLANPQNFSITGFIGNNSTGALTYNCSTCYGAEYMFQRYLYDRFGGDTYLNKMETSSLGSFANIQNATGQPDAQVLLNDFAVALATSNTSATTDPRFNFTNLNLRTTYTDQFGSPRTLSGPGSIGSISPGGTLLMNPGYASSFVYATATGLTSAGSGVHLTESTGAFKVNGAIIQK